MSIPIYGGFTVGKWVCPWPELRFFNLHVGHLSMYIYLSMCVYLHLSACIFLHLSPKFHQYEVPIELSISAWKYPISIHFSTYLYHHPRHYVPIGPLGRWVVVSRIFFFIPGPPWASIARVVAESLRRRPSTSFLRGFFRHEKRRVNEKPMKKQKNDGWKWWFPEKWWFIMINQWAKEKPLKMLELTHIFLTGNPPRQTTWLCWSKNIEGSARISCRTFVVIGCCS